jgi:hypothetical protein
LSRELPWLVKEMPKTKALMPVGLVNNSSPIPTSIEPKRETKKLVTTIISIILEIFK